MRFLMENIFFILCFLQLQKYNSKHYIYQYAGTPPRYPVRAAGEGGLRSGAMSRPSRVLCLPINPQYSTQTVCSPSLPLVTQTPTHVGLYCSCSLLANIQTNTDMTKHKVRVPNSRDKWRCRRPPWRRGVVCCHGDVKLWKLTNPAQKSDSRNTPSRCYYENWFS